jgi:methylmalonyl-CoA epimerase
VYRTYVDRHLDGGKFTASLIVHALSLALMLSLPPTLARPWFQELIDATRPFEPRRCATPSIEKSLETTAPCSARSRTERPSTFPAQGVRVCFVDAPNSQIELIEPLGPDSPIAKFLQQNPLGGQHHVCFEVPDIHRAKAEFEGQGCACPRVNPASARTGPRSSRASRRIWAA